MTQNSGTNFADATNTPHAVFRDLAHYRNALQIITTSLLQPTKGKKSPQSTYLFDSLSIEFSRKITAEELYLDYLNARIILRAPQRPRESTKSLSERRTRYLGLLLREVEAMRTIGITQIYLAIHPNGRARIDRTALDPTKRSK